MACRSYYLSISVFCLLIVHAISKGNSFPSSLSSSASSSLSASRLLRSAKGFFSSDYENLLLEATAPNEERPDPMLVERILATVGTFARSVADTSTNPYRVTLRKLWTKMMEKDWRTAIKALFVLHFLLAAVEPEDGVVFRTILQLMSKETCRKTGVNYFDGDAICENINQPPPPPTQQDLLRRGAIGRRSTRHPPRRKNGSREGSIRKHGGSGQRHWALTSFVRSYGRYVFRRASLLTSHFEELKLLCDGTTLSTDEIVAQLFKAKKLLVAALACANMDVECESDVTLACLDLLVRDALLLFELFDSRLKWCVDRRDDLFDGWDPAETRAVLGPLVKFRADVLEPLRAFVHASSEVLQLYGYAGATGLAEGDGDLVGGEAGGIDIDDASFDESPHAFSGYFS